VLCPPLHLSAHPDGCCPQAGDWLREVASRNPAARLRSRRIEQVGDFGQPDEIELPRHRGHVALCGRGDRLTQPRDLLDLLVVYQYSNSDDLADQISVAKAFAARGKPLLLGEEFAFQLRPTRRFLRQTSAYLQGYLSFFDGRTPYEIPGRTIGEQLRKASLRQFLDLRPYLTHRRPWP
jgi:hypothetical protein